MKLNNPKLVSMTKKGQCKHSGVECSVDKRCCISLLLLFYLNYEFDFYFNLTCDYLKKTSNTVFVIIVHTSICKIFRKYDSLVVCRECVWN